MYTAEKFANVSLSVFVFVRAAVRAFAINSDLILAGFMLNFGWCMDRTRE